MVPNHVPPYAGPARDVRAKYDVSSLGVVIHGAAPCPVTVKQRLIEWLGPLSSSTHAATEGWARWSIRPPGSLPGTVGRPMVKRLVKVADDHGNEVRPGNRPGVAAAVAKIRVPPDTEEDGRVVPR